MASLANISKRLTVALAVNDLTASKPFRDIRVADICEASGMSRSAFYRLFADKYEIPVWCQSFALDAGLKEVGRTLTCYEGHLVTDSGLLLFKDLMVSAADDDGRYSFRSTVLERHADAMRETLRDVKHVEIDDELEFLITTTAESQVLAVRHWLRGRYPVDASCFAGWLVSATPARLVELLNTPETPMRPQSLSYASILMSHTARP